MRDAEIEIEESGDDEEAAYVEYDIATYPSDNTIEVLSQMHDRGDIVIPAYQRKYVWNIKQASLLVESFLLGLPVPPIFLYVTDDNRYELIDGQQRLISMIYFLSGYFGEPDRRGKRQVFSLTGLSEKSPFKFKQFSHLEDKHQRKLKSSVLRAVNIRQLDPKKNNTSVFHIFERLNTGGTMLRPQEIRNAVFNGAIVNVLRNLNQIVGWRQIVGNKKADKYHRDVELILRLFSLFRRWHAYEKPMKEYLNVQMQRNKGFDSQDARDFFVHFPRVVQSVLDGLGDRPFRPRRVVNAAVLEAVMVTMLENPSITAEVLSQNYSTLIKDEEFEAAIRGGNYRHKDGEGSVGYRSSDPCSMRFSREYEEYLRWIQKLSQDVIDHAPPPSPNTEQYRADLAGLLAVSYVAAFENSVKAIMIAFASSKHEVLGNVANHHFDRINSRINSQELADRHVGQFGSVYRESFQNFLQEEEAVILREFRISLRQTYNNIIKWRHAFAHEGKKLSSLDEITSARPIAERMIIVLDRTMSSS